MAKKLNIMDLPDDLHRQLSAGAMRYMSNRKNEEIVCFQASLVAPSESVDKELAEIRAQGRNLATYIVDPDVINALKGRRTLIIGIASGCHSRSRAVIGAIC